MGLAAVWFSTRWLQEVWDSDLSPTQRHIAHIYAGWAGNGRKATTPESVIAKRTGLSDRAVSKNRQVLIDQGWLTEVQARTNKRSAVYVLTVPGASVDPNEVPPNEGLDPNVVPPKTVLTRTSFPSGGEPRSPKRSREITNSSSLSTSPGNDLARSVAQAAGWDDDDERLQHLNDLATHHGATRRSGWLLSVAKAGDLDARMSDYLATTQPKPQTRRWRCGEPLHIGQLNEGDRCPRCAEEIRTGDRPEHMHGQRLRKEAS